jgi:hypothetical protein
MEAAAVLLYAFLARAAPLDNPQKYAWWIRRWSLVAGRWSLAFWNFEVSPEATIGNTARTTNDRRPAMPPMEKPLKRCFSGEALGNF